jgi:hypothetical protein
LALRAWSCRFAHWLEAQGVARGEWVAIMPIRRWLSRRAVRRRRRGAIRRAALSRIAICRQGRSCRSIATPGGGSRVSGCSLVAADER